MSTIKWGQRCIARKFETVEDVACWDSDKNKLIGQVCIVTRIRDDGAVLVDFEGDGPGISFLWLTSALEPIPETPSVWWPGVGDKVMHEGQVKTVTYISPLAHRLDHDLWVDVTNLSPVTTTEITPEEAVKLLEQHTGKSFTIKSK